MREIGGVKEIDEKITELYTEIKRLEKKRTALICDYTNIKIGKYYKVDEYYIRVDDITAYGSNSIDIKGVIIDSDLPSISYDTQYVRDERICEITKEEFLGAYNRVTIQFNL